MESDALRRQVTQHDIIYEVPPRFWEDGFPLGNGHFGGMVWQPGGALYAITEMLLQSHGGVIRVFPALPTRMKNCAFRGLLAEGGHEVSARLSDGQLEWVVIDSPHGGECVVRMPSERTWWVSTGGTEFQATTGRELRFTPEPGGRTTIAPGPRPGGVDTTLEPGIEPGVKGYVDQYGQEITLGKRA